MVIIAEIRISFYFFQENYDWNKPIDETKGNNKQLFPNTDSQNFMLRSEYGDTCLQMPIKKCKKVST